MNGLWFGAIAVLLFGTASLSVVLAVVATRPSRVVVVPGVREGQVVVADQVPDAAVRKFCLLYLYHFDHYSPADVEERSNFIVPFVAPEHQERIVRQLSERATYVLRAKEASQLTLPLPSACEVTRLANGLFRFSAVATRRVLIAGEEKSQTRVRYVLEVKPALPSDQDAYGFVVVGQSVSEERNEDR